MDRAGRLKRLQKIKAIGRLAYRVLKDADIFFGIITVQGENKLLRTFEEGSLSAELLMPHPSKTPSDFSEIVIREHGRMVFLIRWDSTGSFKVMLFKPGDWERELEHWDPIPL